MAVIRMGRYPQWNNGFVKEPIEWDVLKFKGGEAFVLSKFALDCREFHKRPAGMSVKDFYKSCSITWENSDLRKWLNGEFLEEAFDLWEQDLIKVSKVPNDDNPEWGISGGFTRDRVFCLSVAEAKRYFSDDSERKCRPTFLARQKSTAPSRPGECCWRLRTPGDARQSACYVNPDGRLPSFINGRRDEPLYGSCPVESCEPLIRPAMRVKLDAVLSVEAL